MSESLGIHQISTASLLSAFPEPILICDFQGTIQHANSLAVRLLATKCCERLDKRCSLQEAFPDCSESLLSLLKRCRRQSGNLPARVDLTKNRENFSYYVHGSMLKSAETGLPVAVCLRFVNKEYALNFQFRSLSERVVQLNTELAKQRALSNSDPLTGLLNRRSFYAQCRDYTGDGRREQDLSCLVLIDLDHFKQINDTYGHIAGDDVLVNVAGILQDTCRETDLICRWGGEEFALFCPGMSLEDGCQLAERIRLAISEHDFHSESQNITVTASVGVTDVLADDMKTLIARADDALYEAKSTGRNQIRVKAMHA